MLWICIVNISAKYLICATKAVNFVAIPGQVHEFTIPLRNAGVLPFDVSIDVSHYQELFHVTPAICAIEPGELSCIKVRFSTPVNATSNIYKRRELYIIVNCLLEETKFF